MKSFLISSNIGLKDKRDSGLWKVKGELRSNIKEGEVMILV